MGTNHRTAPVELREKLAFPDRSCITAPGFLVDGVSIREGFILSTCNRVEVLAVTGAGSRLISTVNKVAHPLMSQLRTWVETGAEKNPKAWLEILDLDLQRGGQ